MSLNRRTLLARGGLVALAGLAPSIAVARAATERRFVFIIQRGAADGLAMLAPVGDPAYTGARRELGEHGGTKVDAMFQLHASMPNVAALYGKGQALFAHAVALPYRDRSHFDAQNVLETGGRAAFQVKDGWMNRLLGLVPAPDREAIAVSATVPMALRGPNEVTSYAPSLLPDPSEDLLRRVTALYQGDAQLHALWGEAMDTRKLTSDLAAGGGRNAAATGTLAASLLAPANGARIATIETGGWDTHRGQAGRMEGNLGGLDAMIEALRVGLGAAWDNTLVLVATEFGRTVAVNGTNGTDHGTASAALLAGGAVKGGRVIADWPGLAQAQLYEGRDLKPTTALDALIAGALAEHYALDPARTGGLLFPGGGAARPLAGLMRA